MDYVRILHLAATTMECEVERALRRLLESRVRFDYAVVKQLAAPASPEIPALELPGEVDLGVYDRLLTGVRDDDRHLRAERGWRADQGAVQAVQATHSGG